MAFVDWKRVDDLANEIGADAVVEVVAMFLEETDAVMARLNTAAPRTEDYHFLKGSALNLGLPDLASICQAGETETRDGQVSAHTLGALRIAYDQSKTALLEGMAARFGD